MVIKSSTAKTKCIQAVYKPPVTIQIILNKREKQPPEEDVVTTFFSKWQQCKQADFKTLNTKWNTYDSNAKNKAYNKISKSRNKASKD